MTSTFFFPNFVPSLYFHFVPTTRASTPLCRIQPDLLIGVLATSLREGGEYAFFSFGLSLISNSPPCGF
jgi:hypothetical protein